MHSIFIDRMLSFGVLVATIGGVMWIDERVSERAAAVARNVADSKEAAITVAGELSAQVVGSFTGDTTLLPAFVTVAMVLVFFMLHTRHERRR